MCDLDHSTVASEFQQQYSIFSSAPLTQNNSYVSSEIKDKSTHEQLIDIIKKKGKRGFGTSSARFTSENRRGEAPGPGTYSERSMDVLKHFDETKNGFGIGKREMFMGLKDGARVPYYHIDQEPRYNNNYLTRPKHMFQYKYKELRQDKSRSDQNQTPGPGHYQIVNKTTGPTYRNLFKSNISQAQPLERDVLPVIKQVAQETKQIEPPEVKRKTKTQTRQKYIQSTQKYMKDFDNQLPKLLNEDMVFIKKNTNAFIEKNIHLYSSHMNFNKTPAPNAYRVKLPCSTATGFKFYKSHLGPKSLYDPTIDKQQKSKTQM